MSSTQPQIAGSSDVATSLVFSVQGRVVERSTSQWRPEVFVAGIYPGCRINLISVRVISILQSHLARTCTEQQQRPEGKKALLRNSCMPAVALLHAPYDRSSPSDKPSIRTTVATRTYCMAPLAWGDLETDGKAPPRPHQADVDVIVYSALL